MGGSNARNQSDSSPGPRKGPRKAREGGAGRVSSAAASGPRPDELAVHCALHWHGIWDAIASTGQSLSTTKRPQALPNLRRPRTAAAEKGCQLTHKGPIRRRARHLHASSPQHRSSSTKRPSVAAPRMAMSNRVCLPVSLSVCPLLCLSVSISFLAPSAPISHGKTPLSQWLWRRSQQQQQFVAVSPLRHAPRRLTCNINKNSHACVADICTRSNCTSLQARRSCKSACCCVRSENKCVWAYAVASQQDRVGCN